MQAVCSIFKYTQVLTSHCFHHYYPGSRYHQLFSEVLTVLCVIPHPRGRLLNHNPCQTTKHMPLSCFPLTGGICVSIPLNLGWPCGWLWSRTCGRTDLVRVPEPWEAFWFPHSPHGIVIMAEWYLNSYCRIDTLAVRFITKPKLKLRAIQHNCSKWQKNTKPNSLAGLPMAKIHREKLVTYSH